MDKESKFVNITSNDILKNLNEDLRIFTCVALRPNAVDSHGDFYDENVVMKASHDFMEFCLNTSLQHTYEVEKSQVSVVESYIAPVDMTIGVGEVLKGDWVVSLRIHDDDIWKACKEGIFTGLSVGVTCEMEILDESAEEDN